MLVDGRWEIRVPILEPDLTIDRCVASEPVSLLSREVISLGLSQCNVDDALHGLGVMFTLVK